MSLGSQNFFPNLPATCGAQVSSHCRPVAFLCSSRASSLLSRQPAARGVAEQAWEAGVSCSSFGSPSPSALVSRGRSDS